MDRLGGHRAVVRAWSARLAAAIGGVLSGERERAGSLVNRSGEYSRPRRRGRRGRLALGIVRGVAGASAAKILRRAKAGNVRAVEPHRGGHGALRSPGSCGPPVARAAPSSRSDRRWRPGP